MFGEHHSQCWTCGADIVSGCVIEFECEGCEKKKCKHENWIDVQGQRACRDCWQLESDLIKNALEGETDA